MAQGGTQKELKILIVGKTGSGKSTTGNTILGADKFKTDVTPDSKTQDCERKEATIGGRRIVVVDTPGFFDTKGTEVFTQEDLRKCIDKVHPGFHAILVVIKVGRFTMLDRETFQQVKSFFSKEGKNHMILLFTYKDELDYNKSTLEEFLADAKEHLKDLTEMSEGRIIAFNNVAGGEERKHQVEKLIGMIDRLVARNGRTPLYTEEKFRKDSSWCSFM